MTENRKVKAWVLYDADCGVCTNLAQRFTNILVRRDFTPLPLQTPWVRERLGLNNAQLLAEMRLLLPNGSVFAGTDAVVEISRHYWWARPLYVLSRIPPFKSLLRSGYRWLAFNRCFVNGACKVEAASHKNWSANPRLRLSDFLPLLALPLLALLFRARLAPWIFMWAVAFAIYAGCKWLTYREATRRSGATSRLRVASYLLAWPGMDAAQFLSGENVPVKSFVMEWTFAAAKTLSGIVVLWEIARRALPGHPILAGWIGMTGIIFILHFGLFHVLSLAWRSVGIEAVPVMRSPMLARSLAEFWGKRWNTAFNELAFRFSFRPLRRATTPVAATLLVFLLSGLAHELVVSLPARAGYGLPTIYFLVQGLGMIAERTKTGRQIGLGRGVRGWTFTLIVAGAPACWLFHPPFIKNVILPMLHAIGAT
jgi:predicted DCC family thiol-disulfide oxidoreductase YuxK